MYVRVCVDIYPVLLLKWSAAKECIFSTDFCCKNAFADRDVCCLMTAMLPSMTKTFVSICLFSVLPEN